MTRRTSAPTTVQINNSTAALISPSRENRSAVTINFGARELANQTTMVTACARKFKRNMGDWNNLLSDLIFEQMKIYLYLKINYKFFYQDPAGLRFVQQIGQVLLQRNTMFERVRRLAGG